jgi:hypothetical protein
MKDFVFMGTMNFLFDPSHSCVRNSKVVKSVKDAPHARRPKTTT